MGNPLERTSRRLRNSSLWLRALPLALTVFLVVACTARSQETKGPRSSEAAAPSSSAVSGDEDLIATAKLQAAQYDYDAAVATLSSLDSAAAQSELASVQAAKAQAVAWPDNTTIPHIFYHSLIVDPARAFGGSQSVGFSQYMVTVSEFTKQLQQIYANGFVLIHPQRIATLGPGGKMTPIPIVLPPGKKPLVLSLDDLSYYEYMDGHGFATNLVVNGDGKVVNTYTDAAGKTTEGNYDVVPIVDDFVRQHPDFAYRGDKGSIGLTGYNGVLGYRSSVKSYGDTPATKNAQAQAKVVADALKAEGWNFASHTWGHINMTKSSLGWITTDAKLWDTEVRPIVGDTHELIYPFGADISSVTPYSNANPKFAFLHGTEGFQYFFNVDASRPFWMQIGPESVRQARINIDGITLQKTLDGKTTVLDQFFNTKSTIDPRRPLPVPLGGGAPGG
ncbi:hypothetical protein CLV47_11649 [Antricoccus suffuscus]|uniref:Polysaccharide deacetylase n=1 Tax=Antricoccus suffuscus TaxID=1629062 RepID=A0A2T0ZVY1_9ACTN|nr:hypothetical protein [Antricoccus suffuscus]PRZ40516.1 hypothetical protein CLV47_11649 [Antricoccus suffuscus]